MLLPGIRPPWNQQSGINANLQSQALFPQNASRRDGRGWYTHHKYGRERIACVYFVQVGGDIIDDGVLEGPMLQAKLAHDLASSWAE